jgi:hypothetical protein
MAWSRPAVTIGGIDCAPVLGSAAAIAPRASARLNLRVHDPNESADPAEVAAMSLTGALFLRRYAGFRSGSWQHGPG